MLSRCQALKADLLSLHLIPVKKLVILGSTGSIGVQALDVAARSEDIQVIGLAAASSWQRLLAQASEFDVKRVSLQDEALRTRHGVPGAGRCSAARRASCA